LSTAKKGLNTLDEFLAEYTPPPDAFENYVGLKEWPIRLSDLQIIFPNERNIDGRMKDLGWVRVTLYGALHWAKPGQVMELATTTKPTAPKSLAEFITTYAADADPNHFGRAAHRLLTEWQKEVRPLITQRPEGFSHDDLTEYLTRPPSIPAQRVLLAMVMSVLGYEDDGEGGPRRVTSPLRPRYPPQPRMKMQSEG
jgi:hypothetical protein